MRTSHTANLAPIARALRATPAFTEAQLWQELRGSRLGVAFRRQVVIDRYIVDFCAPSAKLVVEVDGGYHAQRQRTDARRDRRLGELGYRVVRLPAELVARRLPEAVARVRTALVR